MKKQTANENRLLMSFSNWLSPLISLIFIVIILVYTISHRSAITTADWTVIIAIVSALVLFAISQKKATGKKFPNIWIGYSIFALGFIFIIYLGFNNKNIPPADWAQILLTLGLVVVTASYAWSAQRQADANVKMAEETREQRIATSRPTIIQRMNNTSVARSGGRVTVVKSGPFSHFEIFNAGNGTAIELEISVVDETCKIVKSGSASRRTFLRSNDESIKFFDNFASGDFYKVKTTYYLVSEYQGISSHNSKRSWYQTKLPFMINGIGPDGEVFIMCDELEFKEVTDKDRINAFANIRKLMEKKS